MASILYTFRDPRTLFRLQSLTISSKNSSSFLLKSHNTFTNIYHRPITSLILFRSHNFHKQQHNLSSSRSFNLSPFSTSTTASQDTQNNPDEIHEFQADVSKVMDIIIHSLYSHPEVFLRELVSNASDATDKKRLMTLQSTATDSSSSSTDSDLSVKVMINEKTGQLIIEDSGIGMTKSELIEHLGSIATSGTKRFAEALKKKKLDGNSLIGQSGVGFYSTFLVADRVQVVTKSNQSDDGIQWIWKSENAQGFSVKKDTELLYGSIEGSGTKVILDIRSTQKEFLKKNRIQDLLRRYAEFISIPVRLCSLDEEESEKKWITVNEQRPLWIRSPKDVSDEEYVEFYRSITKDVDVPLAKSHFKVEGEIELKSVLFIPTSIPDRIRNRFYSLPDNDDDENESESHRNRSRDRAQIRLYVKRVFITDDLKDLLPAWTAFISGVVDSDDLPLNVSREMLQKTRALRIICNQIVRKTIDMLRALANKEDSSDYDKFYQTFGNYLKIGVTESDSTASKLIPLLRFYSTNSHETLIGLEEYVKRMPKNQDKIYYALGHSLDDAKASPYLKSVTKQGFEVLLSGDEIEHLMFSRLPAYKYKREDEESERSYYFEEIGQESHGNDELQSENRNATIEFEPVCELFSKTLGNSKVQSVNVNVRLKDSGVPCAIAQGAFAMSPAFERMMRAQAAASGQSQPEPIPKVLELNPEHSAILTLLSMTKDGEMNSHLTQELEPMINTMFQTAVLRAGFELFEIPSYVQSIDSLIEEKAARLKALYPPSDATLEENNASTSVAGMAEGEQNQLSSESFGGFDDAEFTEKKQSEQAKADDRHESKQS